jgi:hypothetical protein
MVNYRYKKASAAALCQNMGNKMNKIIVSMLFALFSFSAFSHSGGTDSKGCHHDRKNGGYHCH